MDCYVYVINVWNNKLNLNLNESVVVSNEKSSEIKINTKNIRESTDIRLIKCFDVHQRDRHRIE
jgi:hypothetical protein